MIPSYTCKRKVKFYLYQDIKKQKGLLYMQAPRISKKWIKYYKVIQRGQSAQMHDYLLNTEEEVHPYISYYYG